MSVLPIYIGPHVRRVRGYRDHAGGRRVGFQCLALGESSFVSTIKGPERQEGPYGDRTRPQMHVRIFIFLSVQFFVHCFGVLDHLEGSRGPFSRV